jgi:adenosylmethionine-8-amino-7-oxononanoate aminotransferase
MEEVAELEAHYRKLLKVERGYHGEENGKESKGNCKNFYQSQVTNYSPQIDLNREVVESGGEGEDLKMHYVK